MLNLFTLYYHSLDAIVLFIVFVKNSYIFTACVLKRYKKTLTESRSTKNNKTYFLVYFFL
jgi:hypothetical protein